MSNSMKRNTVRKLTFAGLLVATGACSAAAQYVQPKPLAGSETVKTRIGELKFELGVPAEETVARLYDELDFQRAVQAYLWASPIVAFEQSRINHMKSSGATDGDMVTYQGYRNVGVWLTANATTPYVLGFADLTKTGPLVIELPAGAGAGMIDDAWQRPVTDLGQSGPDKAKGASYLVTGPEQVIKDPQADFTVRSQTNNIIYMYRVLETDPKKAEQLKKSVRIYPYATRFNPPKTKFLTPKDNVKLALNIQPRGMDYWRRLHEILQREPVAERDRFFMAMLRPLGIKLGYPFKPGDRQTKILTEAAFVGEAMARITSFDKRFKGALYRNDARWDVVIQVTPKQDVDGTSQIDERLSYTYEAMLTSEGMVSQTPGVGQAYLGAYRDSKGRALDGGKTYRLIVPPNAPAKQFWSVTAYDADTRTLVKNKQKRADRSSRMKDLKTNKDGSTEIWFASQAPKGKESNWIPTVPGRSWFAYLRLYAPLEDYFSRKWALGDIEQVK